MSKSFRSRLSWNTLYSLSLLKFDKSHFNLKWSSKMCHRKQFKQNNMSNNDRVAQICIDFRGKLYIFKSLGNKLWLIMYKKSTFVLFKAMQIAQSFAPIRELFSALSAEKSKQSIAYVFHVGLYKEIYIFIFLRIPPHVGIPRNRSALTIPPDWFY